ncbi:MAG: PIN domain-containing protein [Thermoguttaceae bacterium]|nr:PIN domain-containing protein [Thermoguttaceae bacterium]
MTEFNRVFLDTAPLIYFLDDDANFGKKTKSILEEILSTGKTLVSSVITCEEYLIYPYRSGNQEKVNVFFEFSEACGVDLIRISLEIAKLAAKIKAEYKDFKTMDSLQLATAVHTGCDLFLTNDKQLRRFDGLFCTTVEDWIL